MKMTDELMLELARTHGLVAGGSEGNAAFGVAEQEVPVNSDANIDIKLPPYAEADKRRKRICELLRRALVQRDKRLVRVAEEQELHETLKAEKRDLLDRLKVLDQPDYWNLAASDAAHALRHISHATTHKALKKALPHLENIRNNSHRLTGEHPEFHSKLDSVIQHIAGLTTEGWTNADQPVADQDEQQPPRKKRKLKSFSQFRKEKGIIINPEIKGLSNSRI